MFNHNISNSVYVLVQMNIYILMYYFYISPYLI